ncbi:Elongation factor 1 alpha-like protein [Spathaspora sp. JA1]|nr:Elongation factor 1 alpha-like protein [Spathaspora sp. JA1]
MDYDEDDLDYQSEGYEFNEDSLSNEDYDKLHQYLPQIKDIMSEYDVDDYDLKECLYYNNFDVSVCVEELKANFKKSNKKKSSQIGQLFIYDQQIPTMSKLAQLAKLRSQQRQAQVPQSIESDSPLQNQSKDTFTEKETSSKPTSKLAALANARAKARASKIESNESIPKSIAILDRLSSTPSSSKSLSPVSSNSSFDKQQRPLPSILRRKHENIATREASPVAQPINEEIPSFPSVLFEVAVDDSLLSPPQNEVTLFWLGQQQQEPQSKRRRIDNLFEQITNVPLEKLTKAKEKFSAPSPDDEITNAQKNAFAKDMANLKLEKTTPPPPTSTQRKVKETKPFKKIDISKELASNPNYTKPHKSFVVIGHVDAGKSTLMGRLLFDYGIVDAKTVNKLIKESERVGKGSFALAWIMDQTEEERSHGVTVDICATDFETEFTKFTAIDAPGHKDFVPQMIGGVSQADFALLVVDSIIGEFESGFAMDGQTKEHTILAKNLGIEKICCVVNKLDKENWSQERFEVIKEQLVEFLTGPEVGFEPDQVDFVPISALSGNNVVKRDSTITALTDWYNGPTLGEYLTNIKLADKNDTLMTDPFFLSVHDVYKDTGEIKVSGKISTGYIQNGETIIALPSEEALQINGIKVGGKLVDFAISGELVQMKFKASQLSNEAVEPIRIGDLITKVGSPAHTVKKFTVSIHLFNMDKPLLVGMPFVLFRNNCHIPARISKIIEITSGKKKKKMLHLVSKQTAVVEIQVDDNSSLALTKYSDNKVLGRVVIRREGVTIGAGIVVDFV